jgi:hypothetical protein
VISQFRIHGSDQVLSWTAVYLKIPTGYCRPENFTSSAIDPTKCISCTYKTRLITGVNYTILWTKPGPLNVTQSYSPMKNELKELLMKIPSGIPCISREEVLSVLKGING